MKPKTLLCKKLNMPFESSKTPNAASALSLEEWYFCFCFWCGFFFLRSHQSFQSKLLKQHLALGAWMQGERSGIGEEAVILWEGGISSQEVLRGWRETC